MANSKPHIMTDETKLLLLRKFFDHQISDEELRQLFLWFNSEKGEAEVKELLNANWAFWKADNFEEMDSDKMLSVIRSRINSGTNGKKNSGIFFYLAAVFIAAALIFTGLRFFNYPRPGDERMLREISAEGSTIKNVVLPDGSKVWMNPGSTIVFPQTFTQEAVRELWLSGEAYFEVAEDPARPFVLGLGDVGLKVLGTSFSATNYPGDDQVEVVLKTGRVRLFKGNYDQAVATAELQSGEMGKYRKGSEEFLVSAADLEKQLAWLNGMLIFRDDPMPDVIRQLERWYQIDIRVASPEINHYIFTATIHDEAVGEILKLLEYTTPVKCTYLPGEPGALPVVVIRKRESGS